MSKRASSQRAVEDLCQASPVKSSKKEHGSKRVDDRTEVDELLENQIQNNESRELVGTRRNANKKDLRERPLVINVIYTQYEVLLDAAKETNLCLSNDEEADWDIWWIDGPILPTLLHKMASYQRTNHLPAVFVLARKNLLARNLN